jgi:hypothetical protein
MMSLVTIRKMGKEDSGVNPGQRPHFKFMWRYYNLSDSRSKPAYTAEPPISTALHHGVIIKFRVIDSGIGGFMVVSDTDQKRMTIKMYPYMVC